MLLLILRPPSESRKKVECLISLKELHYKRKYFHSPLLGGYSFLFEYRVKICEHTNSEKNVAHILHIDLWKKGIEHNLILQYQNTYYAVSNKKAGSNKQAGKDKFFIYSRVH